MEGKEKGQKWKVGNGIDQHRFQNMDMPEHTKHHSNIDTILLMIL